MFVGIFVHHILPIAWDGKKENEEDVKMVKTFKKNVVRKQL